MKHIAIAVVEHNGRFLVGQRPEGVPLAGLWEFPGGKVHEGETAEQAAVRECEEETGLRVDVVRLLGEKAFEYAHGAVHLFFYACRVPAKAGAEQPEPRAPFRWVERRKLQQLEFPPANQELLAMLADEARS